MFLMSQPPRQKSLQCLTTLLSASENWTYFTCLAEKIWKASIFHSKHLKKNWPQWKCSRTRNSEEKREWKVFLIRYKYTMLFCGDISVKVCSGTLNFGIIFTPSSPKESLPSPQLLPCSFPGGSGKEEQARTECCTPSSCPGATGICAAPVLQPPRLWAHLSHS